VIYCEGFFLGWIVIGFNVEAHHYCLVGSEQIGNYKLQVVNGTNLKLH